MFEIELCSFITFLSLFTALFFIRAKNLIELILLNSLFSILTVIMYLVLDAPDVGMTEAVVGVITSILAVYAVKFLYKDSYNFEEKFNLFLFIILLLCAAIFIYASADLPMFGQASFDQYYLEETRKDIGIPSVVAAILADYRGYDTLFETLVILIGGISVYLVSKEVKDVPSDEENFDQIMGVITRFILPVIVLFAFYIQMHGEISPGGGFQAGAMLAVSLILYSIVFNKILLPLDKLKNTAVFGVIIYFIVGFVGLMTKKEFLNYEFFLRDKVLAQQFGIIIVELGVGITVSSVMLLIYYSMARSDDISS